MKSKWFWIICILLCLYLSIFSFQKINFLTADIGRHIKNGEIFLNSAEFGISKSELLHTNLFSYTYPDFSFINHHWGSGILIYIVFLLSGYSGLSLAYTLCIILAFIFTLQTVKEDGDISNILLVGLFLVPLIADRTEVRPEAVSYLFISIFIYILYQFSKGRINYKLLFLIPVLEMLWSNLHIYFIFGPFLIGAFLFEALIRRNIFIAKKLGIILILTFLVTLVTPYGLSGFLYPFTIFSNYGYMIVENQSIPFLEKLSFTNPSFLWYKITFGVITLSSFLVLVYKRRNFAIALTVISLTFAVLAFLGIRHITAFALVSLPILIYNISTLQKHFFDKKNREQIIFISGVLSFLIITGTLIHFSGKLAWNRDFGLGLRGHSFDSINFIKNAAIAGPIFNNYDIGGAMIFAFFPKEKVFVDNRPEVYPEEFFSDIYIPMQENSTIWQQVDNKFNFNAIYFYRLDMTPWAQNFLIQRIDDPKWAPVYVDGETLIFLKRNPENSKIISEYELPRDMFRTP